MPRDTITGEHSRVHDWTTDEANGVAVSAERMDEEFDDLADALSNTMVRDGSLPMTNAIDMAGYRVKRAGNAIATTDAVNLGQADGRYLRAGIGVASSVVNDSSVTGTTVKAALNTLKTDVATAQATADAAAPATHTHSDLYYTKAATNSLLNDRIPESTLVNQGDLLVRGQYGAGRLPAPTSNDQVLLSDTTRPLRMKWSGAPLYTLPEASATVLGGVKVGDGLSISGAGVLSLGVTGTTTIKQVDTTTYRTNADLAVVIPVDDTTPLSTEGTEILTLTITPTNAASTFIVSFVGFGTSTSGVWSAAIWTAGGTSPDSVGYGTTVVSTRAEISPMTVAPQTFSVRVGPSAGTLRLNGSTAARYFGGTAQAMLIVEEIG